MTISLKEAVYHKPTFSKIAEYELSRDVSEWNEEIIKQFYNDVNYLPKEMGVDVSINAVDDNKGYAKGSIVVFYNNKQINFPVVVKDYKLSPFDVFIHNDGKTPKYYPASLDNIKKVLSSDEIATLENYWGKGGPIPGVKSTGGVYPKQSVNIWETSADRLYPGFSKMSNWPFLAKKEDLEKLAIQMEAEPDVMSSFVENTGDLIGNVIELKDNERKVIGDDHKEGILDLNDVIKSKQAVTAIDSEFINVDNLIPIKAPSVCELRMYSYPSMEDFLESGENMADRFLASKVGKSVSGIVLDYKEESDIGARDYGQVEPCSDDNDLKNLRNKRSQIFISSCGKYYSIYSDWNKTGIGFYGTDSLSSPGAVEKVVGMIANNTSDDFINTNRQNLNDGSDKSFQPNDELNQGLNRDKFRYDNPMTDAKLLVIYGAGDAWECVKFRGNHKKYRVNDSSVYVSMNNTAVIPANVATIQKVDSVDDPVYKMVIGKAENIYLVPEGSLIINAEYMKDLSSDDFMRPGKSVQKMYEDAEIKKVAIWISPINDDRLGVKIHGKPFEPLKKIAGMSGDAITIPEAITALMVMGMTKEASQEALEVATNRYADINQGNKTVVVYGVRDDYINNGVFDGREKVANFNALIKEYAYKLRCNLIKEASVLSDPEAVDVVLSLNFINEDSLSGYIENLEEMKRIQSEMAKMLVAVRMGLTDLDESALKKSIDGLSGVIKGLEELKIATSTKQ